MFSIVSYLPPRRIDCDQIGCLWQFAPKRRPRHVSQVNQPSKSESGLNFEKIFVKNIKQKLEGGLAVSNRT